MIIIRGIFMKAHPSPLIITSEPGDLRVPPYTVHELP